MFTNDVSQMMSYVINYFLRHVP